jgi:hypothetical protein
MRHIARSLALLAGAAVLATAAAESQASAKGIAWQKDLKKAQALAAKQKKILMVDFTAPW